MNKEEINEVYEHYCFICKEYMSSPYFIRLISGLDICIELPVCYQHYTTLIENKICDILKWND